MLVPLYGFLEGDSIGLLMLARANDSIQRVATSLMQAASVRVRPFKTPRVFHHGRLLDPAMTVAEAGLEPLERIDVRRGDTPWPTNP